MLHWNMSLETGIAAVDHGRRQLLEAMVDFIQIVDDPGLNQKLVAERTGAIFKAMKVAFAAEEEFLNGRPEADSAPHIASHAAYSLAYVDLCKKLVPKIRNLKQAQQACLEIYRCIEHGVFKHVGEEALAYKRMRRQASSQSPSPVTSSASPA
ncbi:hypothetical protein A6A04_06725 [Paramagnetospirillum marisnigri]|uniref:Uncharacterized protein n=1 Tax=Paramagnetospirillum marisnigri TaxID=1285242 RepID=A0A178MAM9_9PROT|nr:hypothetical protein [Paramagnetospirillum marisnigri]OAN45586.1 hypothetical protein A6A04_06725 [Paramagnetospirillum marisnigri]